MEHLYRVAGKGENKHFAHLVGEVKGRRFYSNARNPNMCSSVPGVAVNRNVWFYEENEPLAVELLLAEERKRLKKHQQWVDTAKENIRILEGVRA